MSRIVVLSDLHLAPSGPLCNFAAATELCELLEHLATVETELVLAGDTFDLLQMSGRPEVLHLEGAPELLRRQLAALPERDRFFAALRGIVAAGGACTVLPGNHDPELFHPEAEAILRAAAGVAADCARLLVDRSGAVLERRVGGWEVVIGHGHRADPWNDIDPEVVRRAIARGERQVDLPPGSLLVLNTIDAFRRALDPDTGRPRFPFVDMLKPEMTGVGLLLLYLDAPLALSHAPNVARYARRALGAAIRRRLRQGNLLNEAGAVGVEVDDAWTAALADALVAEMAGRAGSAALIASIEGFLDGATPAQPGFLFAGGAGLSVLRAAVRWLRSTCTFFEPELPSGHDQAIIEKWLPAQLPDGVDRRVVVSGHTHAARRVRLDERRLYLNTGTWTELMELPDPASDAALEAWIAELQLGRVARRTHLTYAEISDEGPQLCEWKDGRGRAVRVAPAA